MWKDGLFILKWSVNNSDKTITSNIDAGTRGWVGLKFSKYGRMSNSDIIFGFIDTNGKPIVSDRFATGRNMPKLDTYLKGTDDLLNVTGNVISSITQLTFTRKLDTGDKYDFPITKGQKINVIFAIKKSTNPTDSDNSMHDLFSSASIILYPN